ncbi:putative transcriptional regulatory protein C11D3.07c [Purpureocillium lavendulum]|uniref:Transcriptional regulatory protein C11D3.07c n=1 Tax=Purpureocillium lavendulum TaxID=1247861 RepID=A0AB34FG72_9HYPO|nr:putative transcriptional regulatory protein C11D3.07c [Purpureocillium lavendulum]
MAIISFAYQSKDIPFTKWISLFTLCFAPLVAHIASGCPQPSYLSLTRPQWHDRLCLYNPTTIAWRYFAITERRIRARAWDVNDTASSNAVFWTSSGWDGSEKMTEKSKPHCTLLPDRPRAELLSWSSLKTVITTLQGAQALYGLIFDMSSSNLVGFALHTLFWPLSILGLLRLCAAIWLTEDYAYTAPDLPRFLIAAALEQPVQYAALVPSRLQGPCHLKTDAHGVSRFDKSNNVLSRIFGWIYLVAFLGLWGITIRLMIPFPDSFYTTTSFLLGLFYIIILPVSLAGHAYYLQRGHTTTTIIPCVGLVWYKVYTAGLLALAVCIVIVACLETWRTPCGTYSTITASPRHRAFVCEGWVPVLEGYGPAVAFGIATETANDTEQIRIANFTGACQGTVGSSQIVFRANGSAAAAN